MTAKRTKRRTSPRRKQASHFDVVGVVASTGGLGAFVTVLRDLEQSLGVPIVVLQHLSPHATGLAKTLGGRIKLPVSWAQDGGKLVAGEVKVGPPNARLEVLPDGTFSVRPAGQPRWRDRPLDLLLESLANSFGPRALGVVLTGLGSDGAEGARKLKDAGGTVLVQSEDTAEAPSMPKAAIEAGGADLVLPLHEMSTVLREVISGARLPRPRSELDAAMRLFAGSGQAQAISQELDWSTTPLGPVTAWPEELQVTVRITMESPLPMAVWWGPQWIQIYNDAWIQFLGTKKHPRALGRPAQETWAEIWPVIAPMLKRVMDRGEMVLEKDLLVHLDHGGQVSEEVFAAFAYSPVRAASGKVLGTHSTVWDTTKHVIAERRMRVLHALAAAMAQTGTARDACEQAVEAARSDRGDLPFVLVYLFDGSRRQATLAAMTGIEPGSPMAPHLIHMKAGDLTWSLTRFLPGGPAADKDSVLLQDLDSRFPRSALLEAPAGMVPPRSALLIPLRVGGKPGDIGGVLITGLSPHRPLDDDYREFLDLLGRQIGAGLSQAMSKQLERERLERLADLDRAKTEFFSNVSHEFRTPLTLLLGPIEELKDASVELPKRVAEDIDVVSRNARRLLTLVNTLLDFSQMEAGRLRAHFEPTDLSALTLDVVSMFRSAIERAGLKLKVTCPRLPEPVWVDRSMWEKIISNLMSNALKFTFHGRIKVGLRALERHVELTVEDTGVGIPKAEVPKLFKRFHRVRGTRARTEEGSGIGLALVRELARLHGGQITVRSEEGTGTAFVVWIRSGPRTNDDLGHPGSEIDEAPVACMMAEEAQRWVAGDGNGAAAREDLLGPPNRGHRRRFAPGARVLVADDNADMRDYVTRLLGQYWEVLTAADGEQALELARRHLPDLIVADVMMPNLDGFGLLKAVRADGNLKQTPVLFVTARAGEETAIEGLLAGADDYLAKPFSSRELVARVGGQLELGRLRRKSAEVNAYRVGLGDALRLAQDAASARAAAVRLLGDYLQANRVLCGDRNDDGRFSIACQFTRDLPPSDEPGLLVASTNGTNGSTAERHTLAVDDVRESPRLEPRAQRLLVTSGVLACANVSLVKNDKVETVLAVHQVAPRAWTVDEIALIEETAERMLAAVEKARAEAALADELDAMTRLHALADRLLSIADMRAGLRDVLDAVIGLVGADFGTIQTLDPAAGVLRYMASRGFDEDLLRSIPPIDRDFHSTCAVTIRTSERVVVADLYTDPKWVAHKATAESLGYRAAVSTPMKTRRHELLGVLTVHFNQARTLADRDLRWFDLYAQLAAHLVERGRAEASSAAPPSTVPSRKSTRQSSS